MLKITFLFCLTLIQPGLSTPAVLDPFVLKSFENRNVNVIVTFREKTTSALSKVATQKFQTRTDRLHGVAHALQALTAQSQAPALKLLEAESRSKSFTYKSLWISNQIILRNPDLDTLQKLVSLDEVESVDEEQIFPIDEPLDLVIQENLPQALLDEVQWGVQKIRAPEIWENSNTAEGVVVAVIGTGARYTHEALKSSFRSEYNWFDPARKTPAPNDDNGLGTHTLATIIGNTRGVGVAPGATWIACKGCQSGSCSSFDLLECAQFVLCPTDPNGNNPDCSRAPHIVSNSWNSGRGSSWYSSSIDAWREAGIIPIFAIGNSGPNCDTVNSPGDADNVLGVGSTTAKDIVSPFSGVGPTLKGQRMKPDISAPGSNIFSAYHTSDSAYATISGTSMATPHVAGTVALILGTNPGGLPNYELIKKALEEGAVKTGTEGKSCANIPDTEFPNHQVGHGRIDARKAVTAYLQFMNK